MARKSQYSSMGMPGAIRIFIAKTVSVLPSSLETIIAMTVYIDQARSFNAYIDQKKDFNMEL